ncbi:MAG: potassium-transporting ATPase subunit B, partial [Rhodoglobus sp.]|nr:potassium-transporting ATPase subunit B [Rhodoglobus sp.]
MSTLTHTPVPEAPKSSAPARRKTLTWAQIQAALPGALRKLDPRAQWRNPVMFIVWVGAALTTLLAVVEPFLGGPAESGGTSVPWSFTWIIAVWLWLTVLFANLAESIAEGRGKAQADTLRKTRTSTTAHRVVSYHPGTDPAAEQTPAADVSSA